MHSSCCFPSPCNSKIKKLIQGTVHTSSHFKTLISTIRRMSSVSSLRTPTLSARVEVLPRASRGTLIPEVVKKAPLSKIGRVHLTSSKTLRIRLISCSTSSITNNVLIRMSRKATHPTSFSLSRLAPCRCNYYNNSNSSSNSNRLSRMAMIISILFRVKLRRKSRGFLGKKTGMGPQPTRQLFKHNKHLGKQMEATHPTASASSHPRLSLKL